MAAGSAELGREATLPMAHLVQRWLGRRRRRKAAVQAARVFAARTTGRPVKSWPLGHCRVALNDRYYICILYRDGLGCGKGFFAVHDSGLIEAVTAREVRLSRPPCRSWC